MTVKKISDNIDRIMDWSLFHLEIEEVAQEDGGGWRAYYPTLGYSVYGVGDTLDEVLESLESGKQTYVAYSIKHGIEFPCPTAFDILHTQDVGAFNNFAFAA